MRMHERRKNGCTVCADDGWKEGGAAGKIKTLCTPVFPIKSLIIHTLTAFAMRVETSRHANFRCDGTAAEQLEPCERSPLAVTHQQ